VYVYANVVVLTFEVLVMQSSIACKSEHLEEGRSVPINDLRAVILRFGRLENSIKAQRIALLRRNEE